MEFRLLGTVEIQGAQGESIRLRRRMERLTLAVLLLHPGRMVSNDRLTYLLWGDSPPARARNAMQALVSRIRAALRQAGSTSQLLSQGQGYLLQVPPDAVDVHRFTDLVARARHTAEPARRSALLTAALQLWRGPALADAATGPVRDELCGGLEEARLAAHCDRVDADLAVGRHDELVPELSKLVAEHPLWERLHGLLMLALYRCGRRADALDAYHRARKLFVTELGLEPGAELRDLATAIITDTVAAAVPPAPAATLPAQLPPDRVDFVGRAEHLRRLDDATATVRVIMGTAGVGKTSLAVHWAHRVRSRFPDGQLYVDLNGFGPSGTPVPPEDAIRTFLDALGVPPSKIPQDLPSRTGLYRSLLADRQVLIVLDNARDSEQVRPLLPGTPSCLAVVTSRNTLSGLVATESAVPVQLDVFSVEEGRELLAHRLDGMDDAAADEVITRCARLPLALAIIAARVVTSPGLTLPEIAAELSNLDAFEGDDAATRVRAVFSSSYRSLRPATARLFRLHGALHWGASASISALASSAGLPYAEVVASLAELIDAHLITEAAPGRYACHDLLRVYAKELVEADLVGKEALAGMHRLLNHYLHTAYRAALLLEPQRDPIPLDGPVSGVLIGDLQNQAQAMDWLTIEYQALLGAMRYAATHGFDAHAWQLAWTLTTYANRQGRWDSLVTVLAELRDTAEPHAHRLLGLAYGHLGRAAEAEWHLRRALDLAGDPVARANTHHNLAWLLSRLQRTDEALDHAGRALDIYQTERHRVGQARLLNVIGWFETTLGNHRRAIQHCAQALAVLEELDDRSGQANTWDTIGYARHQLGEYREAVVCYQRALDLFRDEGDRFHEADTLTHLGDTEHAAGLGEQARVTWKRALAILDELGHADADVLRAKLQEPVTPLK